MSSLSQDMKDAASTTPSIAGLAQLVIDGKIKKLSDIVQTLKIVQGFPRLVNDPAESYIDHPAVYHRPEAAGSASQ